MMDFKVEILNEKQVMESLETLYKDKTKLSETMHYLGDLVVTYAKVNHTFQNRTTNLEHSIHEELHLEGDKLIEWIIAGMPYAPYVELGTSRMIARPFLYPAVEAYRDTIMELLGKAMVK